MINAPTHWVVADNEDLADTGITAHQLILLKDLFQDAFGLTVDRMGPATADNIEEHFQMTQDFLARNLDSLESSVDEGFADNIRSMNRVSPILVTMIRCRFEYSICASQFYSELASLMRG